MDDTMKNIFLLATIIFLIILSIGVGIIINDMDVINQEISRIANAEENISKTQKEVAESQYKMQVNVVDLLDELSQVKIENYELRQVILESIITDDATEEDETSKERLPKDIATNTFRCEPYKVIESYEEDGVTPIYTSAFLSNSQQYQLQEKALTDLKTGIRFIYEDKEPYYCVALAGAYGTTIGDAWEVTLNNGTMFNIILADFKHAITNVRPDDFGDIDRNYDQNPCINIIEFICDFQLLPKSVLNAGTMSALEEFGGLYGDGGNIVSMKYLGRKWNP